MTLCAPWSTSHPGQDATSLCRWFFFLGSAMRRRGGHVDAADLLHMWVRQHHGFRDESVVHHKYWFPIGPLEYNTEEDNNVFYPREVVEMLRDDVNVCSSRCHPLVCLTPSPHLELSPKWPTLAFRKRYGPSRC